MATRLNETPALQAPLSQLEHALIEEYLRARGYTAEQVSALPAPERTRVLKAASVYASGRLSEVESRSHFAKGMHDGGPDTGSRH
jgi:hypothetical protein